MWTSWTSSIRICRLREEDALKCQSITVHIQTFTNRIIIKPFVMLHSNREINTTWRREIQKVLQHVDLQRNSSVWIDRCQHVCICVYTYTSMCTWTIQQPQLHLTTAVGHTCHSAATTVVHYSLKSPRGLAMGTWTCALPLLFPYRWTTSGAQICRLRHRDKHKQLLFITKGGNKNSHSHERILTGHVKGSRVKLGKLKNQVFLLKKMSDVC